MLHDSPCDGGEVKYLRLLAPGSGGALLISGPVPRIWDTYESAGRVIGGTHDLAFYDPAKRKFIDSDGGRTSEERIAEDDFEYLMRAFEPEPEFPSRVGSQALTMAPREGPVTMSITGNDESRGESGGSPTLRCQRCKRGAMAEILRIDPLGGQPGLIALECSKCGYLTSVMFQDLGGRAR
jgi:hypothetical protein